MDGTRFVVFGREDVTAREVSRYAEAGRSPVLATRLPGTGLLRETLLSLIPKSQPSTPILLTTSSRLSFHTSPREDAQLSKLTQVENTVSEETEEDVVLSGVKSTDPTSVSSGRASTEDSILRLEEV